MAQQKITFTELGLINTGLVTQTGPEAFGKATITAASGKITVTNGNGVGGNPTLDVDATNVQSELSLSNYYLKNDASELTISDPDQMITVELGPSATNAAPVRLPPVDSGNWIGLKVFFICNNTTPINVVMQNGGLLFQALPNRNIILTCTDDSTTFGSWERIESNVGNGPEYSNASVTGPFPANALLRATGEENQTWTLLDGDLEPGEFIYILRDSDFLQTINAGGNLKFYYNNNTQAVFSTIELTERYQLIKFTKTATDRWLIDFIHNGDKLTATAPLEITDNDISLDQSALSINANQVTDFTSTALDLINDQQINSSGTTAVYSVTNAASSGDIEHIYTAGGITRYRYRINALGGPGGSGGATSLELANSSGTLGYVYEMSDTAVTYHVRLDFFNKLAAVQTAGALYQIGSLIDVTNATATTLAGYKDNTLIILTGTANGNLNLSDYSTTGAIPAGGVAWLKSKSANTVNLNTNDGTLLSEINDGDVFRIQNRDETQNGNVELIKFLTDTTGVTHHKNIFPLLTPTATQISANLNFYTGSASQQTVFSFDNAVDNYVNATWVPPHNWDKGAIQFRFRGRTGATSGNVELKLRAVSRVDGDVIGTAFGADVGVIKAVSATANATLVSSVSGDVTIGNASTADNQEIEIQIFRDVSTASNAADFFNLTSLEIIYKTVGY